MPKLSETCSCGASFKTDADDAVALVREWRRKHLHEPSTDDEGTVVVTSDNARIENNIGFQIDGAQLPTRQTPGEEE